MGKSVKSERPRHEIVDSTHLYAMLFIHRFEDAEGGLKVSSNSYGFCVAAKDHKIRTTLFCPHDEEVIKIWQKITSDFT